MELDLRESREQLTLQIKQALMLGGRSTIVRTMEGIGNFDVYFKRNKEHIVKGVIDCEGWSPFFGEMTNVLPVYEIPSRPTGSKIKKEFYLGKLRMPQTVTQILRPQLMRVGGRYLNSFFECFVGEAVIAYVSVRKPNRRANLFDDESEGRRYWGAFGDS
jgi:hypothetical protein